MADNISEKKYENPGLRGPAMSARSSRRCGSSASWLFETTIVHCEGAQWVRDDERSRIGCCTPTSSETKRVTVT